MLAAPFIAEKHCFQCSSLPHLPTIVGLVGPNASPFGGGGFLQVYPTSLSLSLSLPMILNFI